MKISMSPINHYYVYRQSADLTWTYERTCGTEEAATDRVNELKKRDSNVDAKWLLNETMPGAFY